MNISIVIPCHNEEKNIAEITERFMKIFKEIDLELYKIIFVDDGSTDNSWQEINSLSKKITKLEHKHLPLLVHDLINNL